MPWPIIEEMGSIDEPIRPLIEAFNKAGIPTRFSCCGFNYKNQGDKDHCPSPYIFFGCIHDSLRRTIFEHTLLIAREQGWEIASHERGTTIYGPFAEGANSREILEKYAAAVIPILPQILGP